MELKGLSLRVEALKNTIEELSSNSFVNETSMKTSTLGTKLTAYETSNGTYSSNTIGGPDAAKANKEKIEKDLDEADYLIINQNATYGAAAKLQQVREEIMGSPDGSTPPLIYDTHDRTAVILMLDDVITSTANDYEPGVKPPKSLYDTIVVPLEYIKGELEKFVLEHLSQLATLLAIIVGLIVALIISLAGNGVLGYEYQKAVRELGKRIVRAEKDFERAVKE